MPRLSQKVECEQNMKVWKRLLRTKRAFSPVIASLILMLLAVAAGVVVYSYTMGWIGGSTKASSGTRGTLQFDSLWHNTSHLIFTVRNVGHENLTPDKVYINGVSKSLAGGGSFSALTPKTESSEFYVAHSLTSGLSAEVKVTCTDGTTASQSVIAKS